MYLAGVRGQDDATFLPQALFWFAVMVTPVLPHGLPIGSREHGRVMAISAGVAFFVLALFSNVIFTVLFLAAVVLVAVGLATMSPV